MASPDGPDRPASTDFAWRVHSAMEAWTGRADLKASILLALQGGALFAALTSTNLLDRARAQWPIAVTAAAVIALLLTMAVTAAALLPALGSGRRLRAERDRELVYFGHLRHWPPPELAVRLQHLDSGEEAAMLASQLVRLSALNWRKHRLLQLSVGLTITALAALVVAVIGVIR